MTPNGGKPPLLLETEMTKTPKAFSEAAVGDRKPVAGGGRSKNRVKVEGVLATTLRRFLRSD